MTEQEAVELLERARAERAENWLNKGKEAGLEIGNLTTDEQRLAKDTSPKNASAIAMGKWFNDIGAGVKQLAIKGAIKIAPPQLTGPLNAKLSALQNEQNAIADIYQPLEKEHPIATGIGSAAPYIAVPPSLGVLGSALTVGGAEALKHGDAEERQRRGVMGAGTTVAGGLLGRAIGKMISPSGANTLSETQRQALSEGFDIGVKPRLSQVTQNPTIGNLEDWAARTPGGAGIMKNFGDANQAAVNRSAAGSIWQAADELSPRVLSQARSDIGAPFQVVATLPGRPVKIEKRVAILAQELLRRQRELPKKMQNEKLISLANDAERAAQMNTRISGEAYNTIRSELSEQSHSAFQSGDSRLGRAMASLRDALDDSAENSLTAAGRHDMAKQLREARPAYANLMTLEKGLVAEGGNVSPARLAQTLRTNNPKAFREGQKGPLYSIGRYGESFKPLQRGSQTYERTLFTNPVSTAIAAPFANVAARATTSPIATAYPTALALNPMAAQIAQNSSQIADPVVRSLAAELLRRQSALAGVPVASEQ